MRVLSYISSVSWGGLEMNAVRYLHWFSEAGLEVQLICVEGTPVHKRAQELGLKVNTAPRNRKYFDLKNARKLAQRCNDFQPDVLWFRDNRDMDLLAWTKRLCRHRFKLVYHQAMQLGVAKKDPLHTWRFKQIDVWVALLPFLADQVRTHTRLPHHRIATVPLGQEPERFAPSSLPQSQARGALNLPQDVVLLGLIGRIDPLKGQHTVIESVKELHARGHAVHLMIMGEPTRGEGTQYAQSLHAQVEAAGLTSFVHFLPYTQQVETGYRALDLYIMASAGETFGNVTVEAMLSGICVVGTNASGTPEILDHGNAGALFEPGSAESLTQTLLPLLEDQGKRERLAQAGHQRALDHYTREVVVKQLLELIQA